MQKKLLSRQRPHEQGQTMVLVAVSLISLLAMAALAIDIVTLYAARSEIQRAADAAALAGAKAIADSGITTLLTTDPNFTTVQGWLPSVATAQVNGVLQNNLVAGAAPALASGSPSFTWTQGNPQITVTLQRSGLPTFFSKIWPGNAPPSVTATATAEAYNPANLQNFTPIAPTAVKPWLVANADPNNGGVPFINPLTGAIESFQVIGETLDLNPDCQAGQPTCQLNVGHDPPSYSSAPRPQVDYVPVKITSNAGTNVCPPCAAGSDYEESIECADMTTSYQVLACGGGTNYAHWDNSFNPGGPGGLSDVATECLIHATAAGKDKGQDLLDPKPWPSNPMQITAGSGSNAPNGSLVTTSSSIVTIPIIGTFEDSTPFQVTIVGFLQAFIDEVRGNNGPPPDRANIEVHVLNIAACSSSSTNIGVTPVIGGTGTSPVPVRLITPP
jgi:Flp pilus assembly protein TadG